MVIRQSILNLLREKPFHLIKLKEVCDLAGINRSTFYNYYKDMYDWKEQIVQECMCRTEAIINCENMIEFQKIITGYLQDLKKNLELFSALCSPNFESNILSKVIYDILCGFDQRTDFSGFPHSFSQQWDRWYVISGGIGLVNCWIKTGMKVSPEVVMDQYIVLLHKTSKDS